LRRLRADRAQLAAEVAQREAVAQRAVVLPTAKEVEELLARMGTILTAAGQSDNAEEVGQVRQVVQLLTGGRIGLVQQGERKAQRGWLQGRFRLQLLNLVVAEMAQLPPTCAPEGVEVAIDYREPSEAEKLADRVKELYDGGLLIRAIAARLGITRNLARKALACWYRRQGQEVPDGRSRRAELAQKHLEPPPYQALADRAMALYDRKLPLGKIAEELGCDRNTVTKAVAFGHAARGRLPPDGRTRRKMLKQRQPRTPEVQGAPATDPRDGEAGA
jgi:hypothetical protein